MSRWSELLTAATERGWMPDGIVRAGIRGLLKQRLSALPLGDAPALDAYCRDFIRRMDESPLAVFTQEANEQHYELPPAYFETVLGPNRKYSSCVWNDGVTSLEQAEEDALRTTCERARLADGQHILELGCGWGSLSLWMARAYPGARITAVSNSAPQRRWIEARAAKLGLTNLQVITADMNVFSPAGTFDRVVSVEMFEHLRNWRTMFGRVAGWLKPGGRFFMHVFCHRAAPYFFEIGEENDWMSRYFFSGGLMPSYDLPRAISSPLAVEEQWKWNGAHYGKTLLAWLKKHDENKAVVLDLFRTVYGREAHRWFIRWRLFYIACEELFRYHGGEEWFVGHYLFTVKDPPNA